MTAQRTRRVFTAVGFAALLITAQHALAQTIHACLTNNGNLVNVTLGSAPTCLGSTTAISWNVQGTAGPQGPTGAQGPQGAAAPDTREIIVGPAATIRTGAEAGDQAAGDCRQTFGEGARWATTRDLRDLSWESTAGQGFGWVNWHPIAYDPASGIYTDISGSTGTVQALVCGATTGQPPANHPWTTTAAGVGFMASRTHSQPTGRACSQGQLPVLCVAPLIVP